MPVRTSSHRHVTGRWRVSRVARPLRGGSVPAFLAVAATAIVLLLLPAAGSAERAAPSDPCTPGFTCTTTCAFGASGNGGACIVRECAAADACRETSVAVPAADLDAPRNCRLDRFTCEKVAEAPARCEVSADGFGAVCTLASVEWRRCMTRDGQDGRCQNLALGGDPFVVAGAHYVPPPTGSGPPPTAPPPTDPGSGSPPSQPAPSSPAPSQPLPAQPAPQPEPTPAPPPTAPGSPAPAKPAPVAAPSARPAVPPTARRRRAPRVAVIRFRSGFGLPPGFRRADACHGAVRVRVKLRGRMLAAKTVRLDRRCRYAASFRIRRGRLRGARVVTVAIRFRGNDVLGATGRAYRVAVPR